MDQRTRSRYEQGLRDGLPICLGYLSVSFAFGMMCAQNGLPFWIAVLISATNLTSAGQFAGTELILAGSAFVEIAVTTFVINIRYLLMSLSLSQKLEPGTGTRQRLLLSFGVTDEIFAVAMQQEGPVRFSYFLGLMTGPFFGWTLGTLLGATATSLLPAALRSALGIAIYGMFLAIIIPPTREVRPVARVVLLAAALSCLFRWLPGLRTLSAGWSIILCAVLVSAYAARRYPVDGEDEKEAEV